MTPQTQNTRLTSLKAFWNRLTEPDPVVKDPLEREQSRLLTGTLWVFLLTTWLLFAVRLVSHGLQTDLDFYVRLAIMLFTIFASFLSRRGFTWHISLVCVVFATLAIFYLALFGHEAENLSIFNYLLITIIFGSLFLPLWHNALIWLVQLAGILLLVPWLAGVTQAQIISGPFSFLLTLGVIAMVMTHYRNKLEYARKLAVTLSEKRFGGIFENSPIGIKFYASDGELQNANPACLNNFGFLYGAPTQTPNLFADPLISKETQAQLKQGELVRFIHEFNPRLTPHRTGSPLAEDIHYLDISIMPWRESGEIEGYLMQLVDISEQKRVEEIVRARRNNLLLISDNLPALVAHIDPRQRYIFTNRPYAEFFKWSEKSIIGRSLSEVVGTEVAGHLNESAGRALAGERVEFEIALNNPNGNPRLMQAVFVPDLDASGQVSGYVAMFVDITERKQAEANLAHKAAQLELLNRVGQHLSALTSISEVLQRAVHLVQETFHYHGVSIFLKDEDFNDLVLMAKSGDFTDAFPEDLRLEVGSGLAGWVAKHGKTRLANDLLSDPVHQTTPLSTLVPARAELCAPILIDNQVIGILDVQSPILNTFDDSDALVMQTMAEQIGISIENARLHTVAQQQLAQRVRTEELLQATIKDKEVLLREIHHRVKNNMQVIASMLNLRAEKVSDPRARQAFQDCQNSISAIASVHKSLYESTSQASIDVQEYLPNLVERLKLSFRDTADRIVHRLEIEPVRLDFDTAIPCGLIVSELLSNVYKYAFSPDQTREQTGSVEVSLVEKDGRVILVVRDNGIGFPQDFVARKEQALGLQLTELLVQQLKGSLTMEGSAGAMIEVVFPSPQLKSEDSNVSGSNIGC